MCDESRVHGKVSHRVSNGILWPPSTHGTSGRPGWRWGLDCSRFPVWLWPEPCFRPQAAERRIILLSASYCGRSGHFPIAVPRSLRVRGTAGLAMRSKVCVRGRHRCSRTRFWSIAVPLLCVQVYHRIASSAVLPLLERSCSCLRVSLVSCVAARCVQCPLALHAVWPTC